MPSFFALCVLCAVLPLATSAPVEQPLFDNGLQRLPQPPANPQNGAPYTYSGTGQPDINDIQQYGDIGGFSPPVPPSTAVPNPSWPQEPTAFSPSSGPNFGSTAALGTRLDTLGSGPISAQQPGGSAELGALPGAMPGAAGTTNMAGGAAQFWSSQPHSATLPGSPLSVTPSPPSPPVPGSVSAPLASVPAPPAARRSKPGFIRGVNIGGWLVLEKWMNSELFAGVKAVDQWTFDSQPGSALKLKNHWSTWFTEKDVKWLRQVGINALRIPIGFWAYDNANTPYHSGADFYLEQSIRWARAHNMKVWVDLHGLPGSQNGWDHSGRAGPVEWQTQENLRRSIKVVEAVALKYGAQQYADTVVGIQLVNEPISWGANKFETTKKFATDAYHVVRKAAKNKRLMVIMHDAFMSASAWKHTANTLQSKGLFGVDTHLYQCFTGYENMNQEQHIQAACKWGSGLRDANAVLPTFVGEWSPVTNVCLKADGSTFPGKSCSEKGCQCTSTATSTWSRDLVEQVRRYVEAQLDTFEKNSSGYFMWSYKGSVGAWSLREGINHGFIPSPVTSRRYPRQCS